MKIDITNLLKRTGNGVRIKEEETLSFPEDGLTTTGPVKVAVHLVNIGNSILVTGNFKAKVKLACVRCLKEFECPIMVGMEEEYARTPRTVPSKGGEVELKEKDFTFEIDDDNTIDLTEAIRQNLLIALPIKPLCSKSCKGIDSTKGKKEKGVDPRLAKLKDILKK